MTCRPRCGRLRVRQHGSVSCWWSLLGGRPRVGHEAARAHHPAAQRGKGMEKTMRHFTLLLLVALLGGTDRGAAQETVETRGVTR